MKQSKFTDSQIIEALKRVEGGVSAPEICREYGISTATSYKWRAKYGGLDVLMMSRMKELEIQNAKKKPLSDGLVTQEIGPSRHRFISTRTARLNLTNATII